MPAPLVSVLTATWQRPETLAAVCDMVAAQTYQRLEHVIVHDGPEPLSYAERIRRGGSVTVPTVETRLREHADSATWFGAKAWSAAMRSAAGEYSAIVQDDDRITPNYIADLMQALVQFEADFVYPRVVMHIDGQPEYVIGKETPEMGQITVVLFKTRLRDIAVYEEGRTNDWDMFAKWLDAGAKAKFVPWVSYWHHVDHVGQETMWTPSDGKKYRIRGVPE